MATCSCELVYSYMVWNDRENKRIGHLGQKSQFLHDLIIKNYEVIEIGV